MANLFLHLEQVSVPIANHLVLDHIDFSFLREQQWALVGPSGSGKTVLAMTLLGKHHFTGGIDYDFSGPGSPFARIALVEQQHHFKNRPGTTDLYYQQRFNSADAESTITVAEELKEFGFREQWLDLLHIRQLLPKPLIQLSNGENKRVQLAIALSNDPELLILDNPFLGLDAEGRATLHTIINRLPASGIHILLITSHREIPEAITHIAQLEKGKLLFAGPKTAFHPDLPSASVAGLDAGLLARLRQEQQDNQQQRLESGEDFTLAVKMVNTTIRYGDAIILNAINWEVKKGEQWNVSGPNGAGKSTILSLITADNPQAYANEIWLFDRRRGSGESIWDIKKKIGFVSPELHLYFEHGSTCAEVIASGLFDTIGLFRALTAAQEERVLLWMQLLSIGNLRFKRLSELSTGQQRMVLLARALIKNPPLLILDEPCQGLDDDQILYFRDLIGLLCETFGTTLIYVSHYTDELPTSINRFLRLKGGEIVS
ncbi:ATP-binding cassette domain-containing protein [Flavitalea flava]